MSSSKLFPVYEVSDAVPVVLTFDLVAGSGYTAYMPSFLSV